MDAEDPFAVLEMSADLNNYCSQQGLFDSSVLSEN